MGYRQRELVEWGITLDQSNHNDWVYDAMFDVYFIRPGSKLGTWCSLHSPPSNEHYYNTVKRTDEFSDALTYAMTALKKTDKEKLRTFLTDDK